MSTEVSPRFPASTESSNIALGKSPMVSALLCGQLEVFPGLKYLTRMDPSSYAVMKILASIQPATRQTHFTMNGWKII